jgi:aspartyl-tRNA(Asn)/glutamyl-tRNA(Gln) amidotransferase subunit B
VLALGVSDAKLEAGSMRFDANVSVRTAGTTELGTRTETKNVNSLRSLQRAIAFEIERQVEVVESGGEVVLETRHWNEDSGVTVSMRKKEESEDYRYFQDPDLLPLEVTPEWKAAIKESLPELPSAARDRYRSLGADTATATLLGDDAVLAKLFEGSVGSGASARSVGNWLTGEVVAHARRGDVSVHDTSLEARHLVELSAMVGDGKLSSSAAKEVLIAAMDGEGSPEEIAEGRDLLQVSDVAAIGQAVDSVLAENPEAVEKIRSGDMKPIGFLMGQVMRATGGRADPKVVQSLLRDKTKQ